MEEIFRAGQELRIAVTPVNDSSDLLESEQLSSRDWFQEVNHPVAGRGVLPGFPYQFGRSPASVRSPAPRSARTQQAGSRAAASRSRRMSGRRWKERAWLVKTCPCTASGCWR